MAIMRRMNGTLGDLGPMDPGGMALTPPTDPGGLALPQPGPMDPGGMALPAPQQPQAPAAPSWQNPAFGAGYNPFAPRISEVNGQTFLNEHGNQRLLQGNEIADAQRYVTDHFNQFGQFGGNTWGSGNAAVDPYMGQIPFPAGTTLDPALMKEGVNYGGAQTYQPGPYQTFTSGGLMPGAMRGAMQGAAGPMWPAIGAAAGAPFGLFGGRRGGGAGAMANRMRGGTLGNLAPTGSSYGVEQDPTLLR